MRFELPRACTLVCFVSLLLTLPGAADDIPADDPTELRTRTVEPTEPLSEEAVSAVEGAELLLLEESAASNESPLLDRAVQRPSGPQGKGAPFGISAFWVPEQGVQGQNAKLGMIGQQLEASAPIYFLEEGKGIGLLMFRAGQLELDTDAIFPDSQTEIPNHLWDISIGTMHTRKLDNDWELGGMVWVGSASDKPFDAFRDYTLTTIGFVNVPARNRRDAWSFSLFYSPNSQLIFPMPGIAYVWRPSEKLRANIGIPFSLEYQPTETLTLLASYMPLTTGRVFLRQKIGEAWVLYGGYDVVNRTYFLSERIEDDERFYLFDQRAVIGVERKLPLGFVLDGSVGYLFDRQLFQATSFSDNRRDEILVGAGLGALLQLVWRR